MNAVSFFELPADDLDRARRFYETVLGISLTPAEMPNMKEMQFPMDGNAFGAAGALVKSDGYVPALTGVVVYFATMDIDGALSRVEANGGKIVLAKLDIGDLGHIAQMDDSEGNRVGLHMPKMGA